MDGFTYFTGPASRPAAVDRLLRASHTLADGELNNGVIGCPILGTTPEERLRAVLDANLVVISPDWATDLAARRDVQVALWAGKEVKQFDPLNDGGSSLRALDVETVQTVIDRGLQVTLSEEDTQS